MSRNASDHLGSTSASLIARLKRHEPEAWRKLADIYAPLVYGWARRGGLKDADAADTVQEVFRSVYKHAVDGPNNVAFDYAAVWNLSGSPEPQAAK